MPKRIKWNTHDVSFTRGNHEPLIAKLDNCKTWLGLRACCTTSTFKSEVKRLAQTYGATAVEIKREYEEGLGGKLYPSEDNVIGFLSDGKGGFFFSIDHPVPDGCERDIEFFKAEDLFNMGEA